MNIGSNIKKARIEKGIKQSELAKELNVYQKDISRWESNKIIPTIYNIKLICENLKISADQLLEINHKKKESE